MEESKRRTLSGRRCRRRYAAMTAGAALLLQASAHVSGKPAEMVFATLESFGPPLVEYEHINGASVPVGGILIAYSKAIADALGLHARILTLPRKRLEYALQAGEVDGICGMYPAWFHGAGNLYRWSVPLISNQDVLVSLHGTPPVETIDDLTGKRIGTTLGFVYPELEDGFASGRFIRDDSVGIESNLRKLLAGRVDYAVINNIYFQYYLKVSGLRVQFDTNKTLLKPYHSSCVFSRQSAIPTSQINGAIEQLQRTGTFEKILQQYR